MGHSQLFFVSIGDEKLVILRGLKVNHFFSLVENVLIVLLSSVAQLKMSTVSAQDSASLLFLTYYVSSPNTVITAKLCQKCFEIV